MSIWFETKTLEGLVDDLKRCNNREEAEFLLIGGKPINLDNFPQLQGIFKTGIGTDNLPFKEANDRGITIALPCEATRKIIYQETADFACHLILQSLFRDTGSWNDWAKTPRNSLHSKTILVVGVGQIGEIVCNKMASFCQVTTYDSLHNKPNELQPLMQQADCVSLHIPLTAETLNFIDTEKLSWMKNGACLVNTARGPIVNEDAIYDELKTGRLFAALDVFWHEPYTGKITELSSEHALMTPHVASTCRQFLEKTAEDFRTFIQQLSNKTGS